MRPDQLTQLTDLAESIMDVFVSEADPRNWNGSGMTATEMDPHTRGARNWDVKNANQVGALLSRTLDLKERLQGLGGHTPPGEDDADDQIQKAEKLARETLKRLGKSLT